MNRIKLSPLAKIDLPEHQDQCLEEGYSNSKFRSTSELLNYSLFIPQHYEPNYAYPLIVWLHSEGDNHRQMLKVMPQLNARNYAAVSVASDFDDGSVVWEQNQTIVNETAERIMVAIDHAKLRLNIDDRHVFIAGLGSGGTMAMRVGFAFPDKFAGVASLNGSAPENLRPFGNWIQCRNVPVFWAHARDSQSFSEEKLCEQLRLLHVGGFAVTLRQYPGNDNLCESSIRKKLFADANRWIMEVVSETVDSIIK